MVNQLSSHWNIFLAGVPMVGQFLFSIVLDVNVCLVDVAGG